MTFLCVPEKCGISIITPADKETPILCTAHNCERRVSPTCGSCKYYAEYDGVCCCYKSEHVADFTSPDDECRCWRKKEDA